MLRVHAVFRDWILFIVLNFRTFFIRNSARSKLKARTGGEKGTTPETTACPEAGK